MTTNQQPTHHALPALTHLDQTGAACMVDISDKTITKRIAVASAMVITRPDVIGLIQNASLKKGDVLAVARIAGIMAAKKTADLIWNDYLHILKKSLRIEKHLTASKCVFLKAFLASSTFSLN